MWICFGKSDPQPPNLYVGDNMIERVDTVKLLGVGCQSNLKWNSHIKEITRQKKKLVWQLTVPKSNHCLNTLLQSGVAYLATLMNDLERVQRRSLRIIGLPVNTLPPLCERIEKFTLRELEAIIRDTNHPCHHLVHVAHSHGHSTRTK